jgi:hypothetical protein
MALLENMQVNIKTVVMIVSATIAIVGPFTWNQYTLNSLEDTVKSQQAEIKKISELVAMDFRLKTLEKEYVEVLTMLDGIEEDNEDQGTFETEMKIFKVNTENEFKSIGKKLRY